MPSADAERLLAEEAADYEKEGTKKASSNRALHDICLAEKYFTYIVSDVLHPQRRLEAAAF
eukprot:scaffold9174_cov18-Prasinocladus_malaysianus.AAC.1